MKAAQRYSFDDLFLHWRLISLRSCSLCNPILDNRIIAACHHVTPIVRRAPTNRIDAAGMTNYLARSETLVSMKIVLSNPYPCTAFLAPIQIYPPEYRSLLNNDKYASVIYLINKVKIWKVQVKVSFTRTIAMSPTSSNQHKNSNFRSAALDIIFGYHCDYLGSHFDTPKVSYQNNVSTLHRDTCARDSNLEGTSAGWHLKWRICRLISTTIR